MKAIKASAIANEDEPLLVGFWESSLITGQSLRRNYNEIPFDISNNRLVDG